MLQLTPVQFNFSSHWPFEIWKIRNSLSFQKGLIPLFEIYDELAETKYDDFCHRDTQHAAAVRELDFHTVRVMCYDLRWLRDHFSGIDLAELSLAIAHELYPSKSFELLEDDEEAIVTDKKRTLVFDIKHFDQISARASLAKVNDSTVDQDREAHHEVARLFNEIRKVRVEALKRAQERVNRMTQKADILTFKRQDLGKLTP